MQSSVQHFNQILKLEPDNTEALKYRATGLMLLGEHGKAGEDYKRIHELKSKNHITSVLHSAGRKIRDSCLKIFRGKR